MATCSSPPLAAAPPWAVSPTKPVTPTLSMTLRDGKSSRVADPRVVREGLRREDHLEAGRVEAPPGPRRREVEERVVAPARRWRRPRRSASSTCGLQLVGVVVGERDVNAGAAGPERQGVAGTEAGQRHRLHLDHRQRRVVGVGVDLVLRLAPRSRDRCAAAGCPACRCRRRPSPTSRTPARPTCSARGCRRSSSTARRRRCGCRSTGGRARGRRSRSRRSRPSGSGRPVQPPPL